MHLPQQAGVVRPEGWPAADPTKGTRDNGEKYLELVVDRVAHFLLDFAGRDPFAATFAYQPGRSAAAIGSLIKR